MSSRRTVVVLLLLAVVVLCHADRPYRPRSEGPGQRGLNHPRGPGGRHALRQLQAEPLTSANEEGQYFDPSHTDGDQRQRSTDEVGRLDGSSNEAKKMKSGADFEAMSEDDLATFVDEAIDVLNEAIAVNDIGNFWVAASDIGQALRLRSEREAMAVEEAFVDMQNEMEGEADADRRRLQFGFMGPGMGHGYMGRGYMGNGMMPYGMMGGMGMMNRGGWGNPMHRLF